MGRAMEHAIQATLANRLLALINQPFAAYAEERWHLTPAKARCLRMEMERGTRSRGGDSNGDIPTG